MPSIRPVGSTDGAMLKCSDEYRKTFLRILPISAAILVVLSGRVPADDFPNELNSSVPEPRILLHEHADAGKVRATSSRILNSSDPLVKLVHDTRESSRRRLLSTSEHTPWQIMHGLLGLRHDFVIRHNGATVSGIEWISSGPMFRGEHWFSETPFGGHAHPYSVPYAFEGHINQFLAILSMSSLPLDHEFRTRQGKVTMRDMLKNAQMTVNEREEVTWTLWALSRYLPPDAQWKNQHGELWSIERLLRLETAKSLTGAPCGGTHGLFALAHARNVYLRTGRPLEGAWLEAEYKIRRHIQSARMQQNSNGTLSSNFFRGRDYKTDFDKRMASAGHILEFLMIALPQDELSEPWVRRAIEATCNDLNSNRNAYVSCSPLYHTVNALSIFLERVPEAPGPMAVRETPFKSTSQSRNLGINAPAATTAPLTTNTAARSDSAVAEKRPETDVPPVPESAADAADAAAKAITDEPGRPVDSAVATPAEQPAEGTQESSPEATPPSTESTEAEVTPPPTESNEAEATPPATDTAPLTIPLETPVPLQIATEPLRPIPSEADSESGSGPSPLPEVPGTPRPEASTETKSDVPASQPLDTKTPQVKPPAVPRSGGWKATPRSRRSPIFR